VRRKTVIYNNFLILKEPRMSEAGTTSRICGTPAEFPRLPFFDEQKTDPERSEGGYFQCDTITRLRF